MACTDAHSELQDLFIEFTDALLMLRAFSSWTKSAGGGPDGCRGGNGIEFPFSGLQNLALLAASYARDLAPDSRVRRGQPK